MYLHRYMYSMKNKLFMYNSLNNIKKIFLTNITFPNIQGYFKLSTDIDEI